MFHKIVFHKSCGSDDHRDDLYVVKLPCASEVVLEVLLFGQFSSLRCIEAIVIGHGNFNDFSSFLLLVPDDNIRLDGPSFHISTQDNRLVIED